MHAAAAAAVARCVSVQGSALHLEVKRQAASFPTSQNISTGCGAYKQNLVSQLQSIKLLCPDAVGSYAEVYAAPLAACSAGQQGSTEQVPFVEVSINGQASSPHSSRTDVRHVKPGVLGRLPSSVCFADKQSALETVHCMYREDQSNTASAQ